MTTPHEPTGDAFIGLVGTVYIGLTEGKRPVCVFIGGDGEGQRKCICVFSSRASLEASPAWPCDVGAVDAEGLQRIEKAYPGYDLIMDPHIDPKDGGLVYNHMITLGVVAI